MDFESLSVPSPPAEPPVKAKPPSPPANAAILGSDVKPNAASSPKEEPNGLDDSINGAPAKRLHSPAEEEVAKRHKDAEVTRLLSAIEGGGQSGCGGSHGVVFLLQTVPSDDSTFKEPLPPSDCPTRADGATVVGVFF